MSKEGVGGAVVAAVSQGVCCQGGTQFFTDVMEPLGEGVRGSRLQKLVQQGVDTDDDTDDAKETKQHSNASNPMILIHTVVVCKKPCSELPPSVSTFSRNNAVVKSEIRNIRNIGFII